ncbi:MAG: hypothetical protein BGO14_03250 [Chlamydiales bacterium 38-26]|nr:hypothetical protein [Chlamydiales bacterium]OJV09355.1 MAG: hypothetical protein BGO14_03250 [Chlamydiales bacterium 38-26]
MTSNINSVKEKPNIASVEEKKKETPQVDLKEKKVQDTAKKALRSEKKDLRPAKTPLNVPSSSPVSKDKNLLDPQLYGNKASNLSRLQSTCKSLKKESGIDVSIPAFQALSHEQIFDTLLNVYPSFQRDWKKFIDLQKEAQEEGGLTSKSKKQLQHISETIEKAFDQNASSITNGLAKEMKSFLKKQQGLLMVRSSGREDSDELSLAGGNESVAGVQPEINSILKAIGTVVASYFSVQSFSQRALANQDLLAEPFMPVLLQTMVGEKSYSQPKAEELFCCGVGYTKELGGETPHLTVIEASYGHNTGVVESTQASDTYYIYPDGTNHEIIPHKPSRLVASGTNNGKTVFIKKDNPPDAATKAVLNQKLQSKLQKICQKIQDVYGKPMDIEWLYDPNLHQFYIVQARPLVKKQGDSTPQATTTNLDYLKKHATIYPGQMIVHKNGETIVISKPAEVIYKKNLNSALNEYLLIEEQSKNHLVLNPTHVVVVQQMGNALSHPACVFRESEIPVICCPDYDPSTISNDQIVLIDTQRGLIACLPKTALLNSSTNLHEELQKNGIIKQGWYKHPIPAIESLKQMDISKKYLKDLYKSLGLDKHKTTSKPLEKYSLAEMMEALTSKDLEVGDQAIKDLIVLLYSVVKQLDRSQGSFKTEALLSRAKNILLNAMFIAKDYLNRTDAMQRLHATKRLEALIYQPASTDPLHTDSIQAIFQEVKLARELNKPDQNLSRSEQNNLVTLEKYYLSLLSKGASSKKNSLLTNLSLPMKEDELLTCLMLYASTKKTVIAEHTRSQWEQFTQKIASTHSRIANRLLIDAIQEMEKTGILSEWLNDAFIRYAEKEKDPILLLKLVIADTRKIKKFYEENKLLLQDLDYWTNNTHLFEDPNLFNDLWPKFKIDIVDKVQQISQRLQFKDALEKSLTLKHVLKAVDIIDQSIKYLRGSPKGNVKTKVERFHVMLQPYATLMSTWYNMIPQATYDAWYKNIATSSHLDLMKYKEDKLHLLMQGFSNIEDFTKKQLLPHPEFNVQAHCVSSAVDVSLSNKEFTLEEYFQIFHQNLLACIACHQQTLTSAQLPQELSHVIEQIEGIDKEITYANEQLTIKPSKIGQAINYPLIVTTYNLPIKYHSALITITHNISNNQTEIQFNMFGHNMGNRMNALNEAVIVNSMIQKLNFNKAPDYDSQTQTLNFSWKFPKEGVTKDQLKGMKEVLTIAIEDSLKGNFGTITSPTLKVMEEKQPDVWQYIATHPDVLLPLLNQADYLPKAFEIILHIINTNQYDSLPLLNFLGLQVPETNSNDFNQLLVTSFIQNFLDKKIDGEVFFKEFEFNRMINYSDVKPKSLAKRLLFEMLNSNNQEFNKRFWSHVLMHKECLLAPIDTSFKESELYLYFCKKLIDHLKSNQKFEELISCAQFMIDQKQYQPLYAFYDVFKETEENNSSFIKQLLRLAKKYGSIGTPTNQKKFLEAKKITSTDPLEYGMNMIIRMNDNYTHATFAGLITDKKGNTMIKVRCGGEDGIDGIILPPEDVRLFISDPKVTQSIPPELEKTSAKVEQVRKK